MKKKTRGNRVAAVLRRIITIVCICLSALGDRYGPALHAAPSPEKPGLSAAPDYMGSERFGSIRYDGLARLTVSDAPLNSRYKYYVSPKGEPYVWEEAVTEETDAAGTDREHVFDDADTYEEMIVNRAGIYTISLWGGAGGSYGDYSGESGEYSSARVYLNEGDVIGIYTGKEGETDETENGPYCHGGTGSYVTVNGSMFMSCSGGDGASCFIDVSERFDYTGSIQTYIAPVTSDYTFSVWGASGRDSTSGHGTQGKGGYATGEIHLESGTEIFICVGGQNGYNGGGSSGSDCYGGHGGNGGGATHIASRSGVLRSLVNYQSSVYIVAGGGGGAGGGGSTSGSGGGLTGGAGTSPWPGGTAKAPGGTQTEGGVYFHYPPRDGDFGYGGYGYSMDRDKGHYPYCQNGGGGGGWYGGCGGYVSSVSYGCGGGGGSGYTGGVSNGIMSNGVCAGNGYAVIVCKVNIQGEERNGQETAFVPNELFYKDHVVSDPEDTVYPAGNTDRSGCCIITEPEIRYYGDASVLVSSPDTESPDKVDGAFLSYDPSCGLAAVSWLLPRDNGTDHSYMARIYSMNDIMDENGHYVQTDPVDLNICSGVYEYRYLIDSSETRGAEYIYENGIKLDTPWTAISGTRPEASYREWFSSLTTRERLCDDVTFTPTGEDKYIHIVCADRAGNISDAFDMQIDGEDAFIPYPVVTEQIGIELSDNVLALDGEDKTYFVRADGETEFFLDHSAYINGSARPGYQINGMCIMESLTDRCEAIFENSDITQEEAAISALEINRGAGCALKPVSITDARRTDHGRVISVTEGFVTSNEGRMTIFPGAYAYLEDCAFIIPGGSRQISSDHDADRSNGIVIIGDGTAPSCMASVNGSAFLPLAESDISNTFSDCIIDRRSESVRLSLRIEDEGAGPSDEFTIHIVNKDNGLESRWQCRGCEYEMELKIDTEAEDATFENRLFNGRFIIYVTASDRVGNEGTESSEHITELDISAEIVRKLDALTGPLMSPGGQNAMKRGESGYVYSEVWGYPEAVLVTFSSDKLKAYDTLYLVADRIPAGIPDGVNILRVSSGEYILEGRTDFTIPLDYDEDTVGARITAYKNGESVSWECSCHVETNGSVLDELMTVLR